MRSDAAHVAISSDDVLQFRPLVVKMAKRWYPALHKYLSFEEIEAIGLESVWKSLRTWRPDGGASKLTYLCRALDFRFNHERIFWLKGKRAARVREVDLFELVRVGDGEVPRYQLPSPELDPFDALVRARRDALLARAFGRLKPRLRQVLEQRQRGDSLEEIGDRLGVSRERARQLYEEGVAAVRASMVQSPVATQKEPALTSPIAPDKSPNPCNGAPTAASLPEPTPQPERLRARPPSPRPDPSTP